MEKMERDNEILNVNNEIHMRNIQYIILRSKQIKKNTIIYEVRDIKTDEVKWVYGEDINENYAYIDEYRDLQINKIINV